jgi:hypothetical protein
MILRARVQNGRLVLDEPTDLPEGAEVELEVVQDVLGQELDADERDALEAAIERARARVHRNEFVDGSELIAKLRAHVR